MVHVVEELRPRKRSGQAHAGELTMYQTGEALRTPGFGGLELREGELREQVQLKEVGEAKVHV